jgi:hypothetical protein
MASSLFITLLHPASRKDNKGFRGNKGLYATRASSENQSFSPAFSHREKELGTDRLCRLSSGKTVLKEKLMEVALSE